MLGAVGILEQLILLAFFIGFFGFGLLMLFLRWLRMPAGRRPRQKDANQAAGKRSASKKGKSDA